MAHWHQQKSNIDNPSLLICRFSILVDSNIWVSLYRRASNLTSLTTVSDIVRLGICTNEEGEGCAEQE